MDAGAGNGSRFCGFEVMCEKPSGDGLRQREVADVTEAPVTIDLPGKSGEMMEDLDSGELAGTRIKLYDGRDMLVFAKLTDRTDLVVVSFTGRSKFAGEEGAGEGFMDKNGISAVYFVSKRNIWWQTREITEVLPIVRAFLDKLGSPTVVTYGSSMGGYGALLCAGPLRATRAVAAAPQYSVDPAIVPWDDRYRRDAKHIDFVFDGLENHIGDADVVMLYDPYYDLDSRHAALIGASRRNVTAIPIPFAQHDALPLLSQSGQISATVLSALRGTYKRADYLRALRPARRSSWLAYIGAARIELSRNRKKSALGLARRAHAIMTAKDLGRDLAAGDRAIETYAEILGETGHPEEAFAVLQSWMDRRETTFAWAYSLKGRIHARLGNTAAAHAAFVQAMQAAPGDRFVIRDAIQSITTTAEAITFFGAHREPTLRYPSTVKALARKVSHFIGTNTLEILLREAEPLHADTVRALRSSQQSGDGDSDQGD